MIVFQKLLVEVEEMVVLLPFFLPAILCVLMAFHPHRCNNVLYIRGVEEEEEDGEMRE